MLEDLEEILQKGIEILRCFRFVLGIRMAEGETGTCCQR